MEQNLGLAAEQTKILAKPNSSDIMSKKIISYAVWGNRELYNRGIVNNVQDAVAHYPGWVCKIYCATDSPAYPELLKMDCEVVPFDPPGLVKGMYSWTNLMQRYYSAATEDLDACIFRDADSRLSDREAKAVDQWLASGKALHVIHDYPAHYNWPICGGMWGIRGGWLNNIKKMAECWMENRSLKDCYDRQVAVDEYFLSEVVWPMFKYGNYMGHGPIDRWDFKKVVTIPPFGDNENVFPPHAPMRYGTYIGHKLQPNGMPYEDILPTNTQEPTKRPTKLFRFHRST